ncbi:hypothetical protein KMP13_12175 [Epibacterium ulvae]|uniref:hypothetical protein n=1 Tax=Epibacterium ulvae TaxID=1156985 RepID=UPI001BFC597A|nr:hypothetical protein [Epibacterium ulvae]MBT8154639.1 hypothetical protein [Epibacterium ulvae]
MARDLFGLGDVFWADQVAQIATRQIAHFSGDQFAFAVHLGLTIATIGRRGLACAAGGIGAFTIPRRMHVFQCFGWILGTIF